MPERETRYTVRAKTDTARVVIMADPAQVEYSEQCRRPLPVMPKAAGMAWQTL